MIERLGGIYMKYTVELPKIICLMLIISKFAKDEKYYNTNDLIKIANKIKPELVRLRKDKNDYKYFEDTNFGGLRGNFSTALTLRGLIKKNNSYASYYGLGKNDRLLNAYKNGEIILDTQKFKAYTNNHSLKKMLEFEARNLSIREDQAHIKIFLKKNKNFPLKRDYINFKKLSVLKSSNNQYFLRILFNTFISDNVIEYNLYNYLSGSKVKKFNIHALFVVPSRDNNWNEFYVIDSKEILLKGPLLLYFDKDEKKFYDLNSDIYPSYSLTDGLNVLSDENGNITERLNYNWFELRKSIVEDITVERNYCKEDEFSIFLKDYLKWKKNFIIYDKRVVDLKVSASGGPDVILKFSGGTTQKLELEHKWNNYVLHYHHKSPAWKDAWLYAGEEWNFDKIKKVFSPYIDHYLCNIPKVFLSTDKSTGEKKAYEVDWMKLSYVEIEVKD